MKKNIKRLSTVGLVILFSWLISLVLMIFSTNEGMFLISMVVFVFSTVLLIPLVWGLILGFYGKEKIYKKFNDLFSLLFMLLALSLGLFSLGILIYQIVTFLGDGNWISISVIDMMNYFNSSWSNKPDSLIGVWKILKAVPLSIFVFVSALLVLRIRFS